jgi:hypothetical protein
MSAPFDEAQPAKSSPAPSSGSQAFLMKERVSEDIDIHVLSLVQLVATAAAAVLGV